ncbi:agmatinase, mitochondrial-like [Trematomus bernacchii]|uniref:agmatinase, mitochondrial-like n=1 Tax=Trematomus bernacchii TaxID=40690 RepID=UPI00146E4A18|nr:agmatinase, mitochondrial-like [Trematomus bernacchii]
MWEWKERVESKMTPRLRTSGDGEMEQPSTSRMKSPTFWSSALGATAMSSVFLLFEVVGGHPGFDVVQAVDERLRGELGGWSSAEIDLGIISVAVEVESMMADDLTEGEHVNGEHLLLLLLGTKICSCSHWVHGGSLTAAFPAGGDHTIAYPILQAVAEKHGPVGLVHVDAHADTSDVVLGERIGHGTPFRRCVEEGLLDCSRVVQIGLRGSGYSADSYACSRAQGFRVVQVEECWFKSLAPLMEEVRGQMGGGPVYLSFDIDALDPGFAPGTGTPEIAGLTPIQGVEIIRGCRGLNLVGCDLVEVSPPYDTTGNTALTGANLLFEMLCVLPNVKYL